jgi:hypothetical protein
MSRCAQRTQRFQTHKGSIEFVKPSARSHASKLRRVVHRAESIEGRQQRQRVIGPQGMKLHCCRIATDSDASDCPSPTAGRDHGTDIE